MSISDSFRKIENPEIPSTDQNPPYSNANHRNRVLRRQKIHYGIILHVELDSATKKTQGCHFLNHYENFRKSVQNRPLQETRREED